METMGDADELTPGDDPPPPGPPRPAAWRAMLLPEALGVAGLVVSGTALIAAAGSLLQVIALWSATGDLGDRPTRILITAHGGLGLAGCALAGAALWPGRTENVRTRAVAGAGMIVGLVVIVLAAACWLLQRTDSPAPL